MYLNDVPHWGRLKIKAQGLRFNLGISCQDLLGSATAGAVGPLGGPLRSRTNGEQKTRITRVSRVYKGYIDKSDDFHMIYINILIYL